MLLKAISRTRRLRPRSRRVRKIKRYVLPKQIFLKKLFYKGASSLLEASVPLPFKTKLKKFGSISYQKIKKRGLRLYEDRREWHPAKTRPIGTFSTGPVGIVQAKSSLAFKDSSRVLICVRRKIRKQIIHALGHAGKIGQKSPRRNENSQISCI